MWLLPKSENYPKAWPFFNPVTGLNFLGVFEVYKTFDLTPFEVPKTFDFSIFKIHKSFGFVIFVFSKNKKVLFCKKVFFSWKVLNFPFVGREQPIGGLTMAVPRLFLPPPDVWNTMGPATAFARLCAVLSIAFFQFIPAAIGARFPLDASTISVRGRAGNQCVSQK